MHLKTCVYGISRQLPIMYNLYFCVADGLLGEGISPQVFITLASSDIDELGFTFGGKKLLKSLLETVKVNTATTSVCFDYYQFLIKSIQ